MQRIRIRPAQGIAQDGRRLLKRYSVFGQIAPGFFFVPVEAHQEMITPLCRKRLRSAGRSEVAQREDWASRSYSSRNATIGSIRNALRVGIHVATSDTAASRSEIPSHVGRSVGSTS